jgi:mRNA-decapping enzyme subunit 2
LCVRFIINLPREELESVERICFQVEEAQWFYEDFIRPLDPNLPSLNLRQFCLKIFQHCPLFSAYDAEIHSKAFSEFLAYKTRVPVRGAIMLNEAMDEVVLVKGWKKNSSWSFPRGKINKDEKDIDCAIREVYEETGYDIRSAGLIENEDAVKAIDVTMREQHMKLFVFLGVPQNTHFEPRTRKEISKIEWYKLTDLPALKRGKQQTDDQDLAKNAHKFYMVAPFMGPLKRYIAQIKKQKSQTSKQPSHATIPEQLDYSSAQELVSSSKSLDDMNRLMTQLRQSQQASRENNFPEVTESHEPTKNASVQLKSLLNLPGPSESHPRVADDFVARENKAQAMLNLLRGSSKPVTDPSIPIFNQLSVPPAKTIPLNHRTNTAAHPVYASPPAVSFSPEGSSVHNNHAPFSIFNEPVQSSQHVNQDPISSFRQIPKGQFSSTSPEKWSQDAANTQGLTFLGDRQTIAPPASKLPLPRLNAHSSALLNLFKTGSGPRSSSPQVAQLSAEPVTQSQRTELAASKPMAGSSNQPSFARPTVPEVRGASYALASSLNSSSSRASQKTPSQQEALLSLFKSPQLPAKISPSLASPSTPSAPVELAATQESTRPSTQQPKPKKSPRPRKGTARNISPLTEDERSGRLTNDQPDLSPDLSATVTGPLKEVQFETIKSPERKTRPKVSSPKAQSKLAVQQPIKILPRPSSSHKAEEPVKDTKPSSRQKRNRGAQPSKQSQQPAKPFQPQILKRPTVVTDESPSLPTPDSKVTPQKILTRSLTVENHPSQTTDQKASLLALFGRPTSATPPIMSASALPVSPLSERPPVESALPSPLGTGRSRIGSLQSVTGDSLMSGKQTPKATIASPIDKEFLLGFLDGIAKEGGK